MLNSCYIAFIFVFLLVFIGECMCISHNKKTPSNSHMVVASTSFIISRWIFDPQEKTKINGWNPSGRNRLNLSKN